MAWHLGNLLATRTIGAAYTSSGAAMVRRWCDRASSPDFSGRAALVAHVFYADLIEEVLACLANCPPQTDLIVTVPEERKAAAARALSCCPQARIVAVANRGRDVAPFFQLLNDGLLDCYDVVLKLHTKRSPHLRDGDIRRRLLFTALAGSRRRVHRVLALFRENTTGLVGWQLGWRSGPLFWMHNRPWVERLAAEMAVPIVTAPSFFEGSMFWVRPRALAPLRDLNITVDHFEAELGQTDGMLHHALERLFATAAAAGGYRVRDLGGRSLM